MDLAFEAGGLDGEFLAQLRQPRAIDLDPIALHLGNHGHERAIDPLIDPRASLDREARLQERVQAKSDVGILGRILGRPVDRHLAEGDRLLARAAEFLEG